jgi:elongation factor Ts
MAFTAKDVMALKERTNAGMMECKKALTAADGNVDRAIELLREWGTIKGASPKSTEMKEGMVAAQIAPDGKLGVLLRLGCQTDFVARNEMFQKLLKDILKVAFEGTAATPAELIAAKYPDGSGRSIDAVIKELVGSTIKENIEVTGLARYAAPNGMVGSYVHHNSKVGALVQADGANNDAVKVLLGEVSMHIAAGMPQVAIAVDRSGVPQDIMTREREAAGQGLEGKPEQIKEKIVTGKVDKALSEIVLIEQPFIKDEKMKIKDLVAQAGKAAGAPVTLKHFARFKVGEA